MYKNFLSSLVIMGTVLSSSPVFSANYVDHPYPLSNRCSRKPCYWQSKHWSPNFDPLSNTLEFAQYFWL